LNNLPAYDRMNIIRYLGGNLYEEDCLYCFRMCAFY